MSESLIKWHQNDIWINKVIVCHKNVNSDLSQFRATWWCISGQFTLQSHMRIVTWWVQLIILALLPITFSSDIGPKWLNSNTQEKFWVISRMKKKEVHVELFGGETQLFEEKVLKYTKNNGYRTTVCTQLIHSWFMGYNFKGITSKTCHKFDGYLSKLTFWQNYNFGKNVRKFGKPTSGLGLCPII